MKIIEYFRKANNNVAVFSTHSFWPHHFETELEIIVKEIEKNNKIISCLNTGIFNLPLVAINTKYIEK